MRQIQVWRERETSQVEVKGLKKAAFLKRETSVALASYHYGTEGIPAEPPSSPIQIGLLNRGARSKCHDHQLVLLIF